jgi:hypothetical protein
MRTRIRIWNTASKCHKIRKAVPSVLFQFWFPVLLNIGIQSENRPIRHPPCAWAVCWMLNIRVVDPAFHFDADPDSAFHFKADADPDPAFHFNADPDPDPALHQSVEKLRSLLSIDSPGLYFSQASSVSSTALHGSILSLQSF